MPVGKEAEPAFAGSPFPKNSDREASRHAARISYSSF
jgi:hypothetical protein